MMQNRDPEFAQRRANARTLTTTRRSVPSPIAARNFV
jgi:hypothetical protein